MAVADIVFTGYIPICALYITLYIHTIHAYENNTKFDAYHL